MDSKAYEQSMKYIENFYSKCALANDDVDGDEPQVNEYEEDYIVCPMNNGSSILMMDRDGSDENLHTSQN